MNRLNLSLISLGLAGLLTGAVAQEDNLPSVNTLTAQGSENGVYLLAAKPALEPVRLNTMHSWTLRLADGDGEAVQNAKIDVDGGMPDHGHGLPTSPRVSPGPAPGEYLLKGLRFNMSGVWELRFDIADGEQTDRLRLRFVVEDSTGR